MNGMNSVVSRAGVVRLYCGTTHLPKTQDGWEGGGEGAMITFLD